MLLRDPEVDPDQAQKSCESGTLTLHIFVSDGWPIPQFTGYEFRHLLKLYWTA